MKRDKELMREILTRCHDGDAGNTIPGYTDTSIRYHKALLVDDGLATGSIKKDYTQPTEIPLAVVLTGVTPKGHDFLEAGEASAGPGKDGAEGLSTVWDDRDFQRYYRNLLEEYQERNGREAQQLLRSGLADLAKSPGHGPLLGRIARAYARKGLYEPPLEAIEVFDRACGALGMTPTEEDMARLQEHIEEQIRTSKPHVDREVDALYRRHANMSARPGLVEQIAAEGLYEARRRIERRTLELRHAPRRLDGAVGDAKPIGFTIMQIGDANLDSVYQEAIRPAIEDCGLAAKRVDKHTEGGLLKSEIIEFIHTSRIVVADVTNERPNCYLEIGFCMGTGKFSNLILTARQDHLSTHPTYSPGGPRVHFDLQGYDMLFWDPANLGTFRQDLATRIRRRLSLDERTTPKAAGKEEPGSDWLRAFVMGSRQEMGRRGFNRFTEIEHWVSGASFRWEQDMLLAAARVAQVPGSGWPIGMVLEPPDKGAPRPRKDGIHAEIEGGPSTKAYDAWAINRAGHFVQADSPIEAMTAADEVQFDTTIRRTAEALAHARRLYNALGISDNQEISVRIGHHGLIDKALGAADAGRYLSFTRRSSEDRVVQEIDVPLRDLAGDALARQVEELLKPLFMVFQFMRFAPSVYDEIVDRFRATHPDS